MQREIAGYGTDENLAFVRTFPESKIPELKKFLDYDDDENLIDAYRIPPSALRWIAEILHVELPAGLDYFLETSA